MENKENNDQNESNNNNELMALIGTDVLPLLEKIQTADTKYEELIIKKSYFDSNEKKLSDINTMLELKYSQILHKIKYAEETQSQLPGIIDSIKFQIEEQHLKNRRNTDEQWDTAAEKIANYARKFPQAFMSNENLNAEIEKNREETAPILEQIKELKLQDDNMDLQIPHKSLIDDISKNLENIKSINGEVKRNDRLLTENIKMLAAKKKHLLKSIDELKKKIDKMDRQKLA